MIVNPYWARFTIHDTVCSAGQVSIFAEVAIWSRFDISFDSAYDVNLSLTSR